MYEENRWRFSTFLCWWWCPPRSPWLRTKAPKTWGWEYRDVGFDRNNLGWYWSQSRIWPSTGGNFCGVYFNVYVTSSNHRFIWVCSKNRWIGRVLCLFMWSSFESPNSKSKKKTVLSDIESEGTKHTPIQEEKQTSPSVWTAEGSFHQIILNDIVSIRSPSCRRSNNYHLTVINLAITRLRWWSCWGWWGPQQALLCIPDALQRCWNNWIRLQRTNRGGCLRQELVPTRRRNGIKSARDSIRTSSFDTVTRDIGLMSRNQDHGRDIVKNCVNFHAKHHAGSSSTLSSVSPALVTRPMYTMSRIQNRCIFERSGVIPIVSNP